jgi:hypothetical protein
MRWLNATASQPDTNRYVMVDTGDHWVAGYCENGQWFDARDQALPVRLDAVYAWCEMSEFFYTQEAPDAT